MAIQCHLVGFFLGVLSPLVHQSLPDVYPILPQFLVMRRPEMKCQSWRYSIILFKTRCECWTDLIYPSAWKAILASEIVNEIPRATLPYLTCPEWHRKVLALTWNSIPGFPSTLQRGINTPAFRDLKPCCDCDGWEFGCCWAGESAWRIAFREFGVKGLARLTREEDLKAVAIGVQKQEYTRQRSWHSLTHQNISDLNVNVNTHAYMVQVLRIFSTSLTFVISKNSRPIRAHDVG